MNRQTRLFFGWWVLTGVVMILVVSSGLGFYNLSVLLAALTAERGFTIAAASAAPSLFFLTSGICGIFIAMLIERYDIRYTLAGGAVICSVALVLIGRVTGLWQLYGAFILFGLGFSASALLPATTLATRWFRRRRSLAVAIAMTGLSLGGMCLTPVSAWLIAALQLPRATLWLALLYLLGIVPIVLLLIKPYPAILGLRPDGVSETQQDNLPAEHSIDFHDAVRTRYFIAVTGAYAFILMSQVGAIAHLFKLVEERADGVLAASSISLMAGCSLVARLLGGWLATSVSQRHYTLFMMLLQASALVALALATDRFWLIAAVVLFGISIGNILMMMPLLLAEAFGIRHFSRIYSMSQLVVTFGVAGGPLLMGIVHTLGNGYTAAFSVGAGCSLLACVILLLAGRVPAG
jgi:MFS family permease